MIDKTKPKVYEVGRIILGHKEREDEQRIDPLYNRPYEIKGEVYPVYGTLYRFIDNNTVAGVLVFGGDFEEYKSTGIFKNNFKDIESVVEIVEASEGANMEIPQEYKEKAQEASLKAIDRELRQELKNK